MRNIYILIASLYTKMMFSKTELNMLSELGNGNKYMSEIAKSLKISASQSYRIAQKLIQKGIISLKKSILLPEMKTHVNLLLKMLSDAPNLIIPLSGTGLQIYLAVLEPKTIREIEKETGLHKTTALKKINQGRRMSLLIIKDRTFKVNEKLWPGVKEYLLELKKYEESVDMRVPVNSIIYFKNDYEIVFSNKEISDAEKTAFSAYERYGIKLLLITNYYYLPKKRLTKVEVFMHSLYVAEKSKDIRHLIFAALFMAKYRKQVAKITHQIADNLTKVLSGENIPGYPTLAEIKDRAGVYNIEV